ncbi:thioredoxin family protein [Alistipes sp. OttesenSCG-928-B03]|nr:thioredoxin family protein [Alistipes sp. OttesenSCG-928-B03]
MKKLILPALLLALAAADVAGQDRKIGFAGTDWDAAVATAREQKKLIFVDCYTTWCGPCKGMDANVFTRNEVADFHNANFVNLKLDIEHDEAGIRIANNHEIGAVPTFFWFDPATGELVHKHMGAAAWDKFLEISRTATDPAKNLAGFKARYEAGDRTPEFMDEYLALLARAGSFADQKAVRIAYLENMPDDEFFTEQNWALIAENLNHPMEKAFHRTMEHRSRFYDIAGKEVVDAKLDMVLNWGIFYLTRISKDDAMRGIRPDEAKNQEYIDYLLSIDFEGAPWVLAQMYYARYSRDRDMRGMFNTIRDIFNYNLIHGKPLADFAQNTFYAFRNLSDRELLQEVSAFWTEQAEKPWNEYMREMILERKGTIDKRLEELQ